MFATWRNNAALLQDSRDYSNCALTNSGLSCGGSANAIVPNFFIYPFDEDGQLRTEPRPVSAEEAAQLGLFKGE